MTRRLWLLAALIPAACGTILAPADTARMPPGVFEGTDPDVPAVQYAAYAFASSSRTYGNPAAGAQAVLALDYIAGQINSDPRWTNISTGTKVQLLDAREQARAALGIAPNAPSQQVVDSLVAVRNDLRANDQAGAQAAVTNPAFTKTPAETLQLLANLPYLQAVNLATTHASEELFEPPPDNRPTLLGGP